MIKTWQQRCEEHPDHQTGMVSGTMIEARMQEEIDDLRAALATENIIQDWDLLKENWSINACKAYAKQLRDKTRANTAEHAAEAIEYLIKAVQDYPDTDKVTPLYTASPRRKPLSDHKIAQILDRERMKWNKSPPIYTFDLAFARAIEAAHGIGEE